jgi:hypothetical protein
MALTRFSLTLYCAIAIFCIVAMIFQIQVTSESFKVDSLKVWVIMVTSIANPLDHILIQASFVFFILFFFMLFVFIELSKGRFRSTLLLGVKFSIQDFALIISATFFLLLLLCHWHPLF